MKKCLFCDPEYRRNHTFFENEFFFVTFDIHPVSPGHTLIIPKRHVENLGGLDPKEWNCLQMVIQKTIQKMNSIDLRAIYQNFIEAHITDNSVIFCQQAISHPRINTSPDAYNHGINDGKAAGRTVGHLHWHIIPRFENDVEDPRGGIRYVIPNHGNYNVPR